MRVDDPLVRDLLRPRNLPERVLRFISTHASFVFLTRRFAYKIKRAKDYGFFDYSTLERRKFYCREEVRLNRRAAPDVYLGVLPVYRDAAGHSLTRPGRTVVDYAVHMKRLPDERNTLSLLRRGRLGHDELSGVAAAAADFFRRARRHGNTSANLRGVIQENFRQARPYVGTLVSAARFRRTRGRQLQWLRRNARRLRGRPARDGHGDLRLEHVYLLKAGPVLVDCIEFSDAFRILDPALDAAFYAMELAHFGRDDLSEYFLARFAYESDDYGFYPIVDGYVSYRAWVRGKVACFLAGDPLVDRRTRRAKAAEARKFFALADRRMNARRGRARLIAVGGLIGTGKSTAAEALSRRHSIPIVSADATRKFLAGLAHDAPGGPRLYTPAFSRKVQAEILRRAGDVLASGRSVIVDTSFRTRELRKRARKLALSQNASFVFVECRVPDAIARKRLRARSGGVSDARDDLFDAFKKGFEPVVELPRKEHIVVDTSAPLRRLPL